MQCKKLQDLQFTLKLELWEGRGLNGGNTEMYIKTAKDTFKFLFNSETKTPIETAIKELRHLNTF